VITPLTIKSYIIADERNIFRSTVFETVEADSPGQEGAARRQGLWKAYAELLEKLGFRWDKNRGELADLKSDSSEA
jgi:hypothetical protein